MAALAFALAGYLLGCVATGYYLVRLRTGRDIRTIGSGATGGRNVARVLGKPGFAITGLGDLAKSAGAVVLPLALGYGAAEASAALVGVTLGHCWPVQLRFRGGKGIAPAVGGLLVLDPPVLVAGALLAGVVLAATRRMTPALLATFAAPLVALALGRPIEVVAGILALVVLVLVAHGDNVRDELRAWRPG
ncbi:MAG: hypothetical protein A2X23_06390 [Chloroflexi bacterium GWC2_73_18]|nr:MAG: hypothetical protein A2X23_06390 [Chloroflexi bacterium GWC2_73_18]